MTSWCRRILGTDEAGDRVEAGQHVRELPYADSNWRVQATWTDNCGARIGGGELRSNSRSLACRDVPDRLEIGNAALLELSSAGDSEPTPVQVKTLVSRGARTSVVSQAIPPKELRFDAMRGMLRIIPCDELLGV